MTAPLHPDLVRLGDALEEAAARDLAGEPESVAAAPVPVRRRSLSLIHI